MPGTAFAEGVGGRLGAAKSDAYVRSVLQVEARSNSHIARYMLISDLAYVLSATELGYTPKDEGRLLIEALLKLFNDVEDLSRNATALDIVVQREAWILERVPKSVAARLHFGRNRGESVRGYLPKLFFRDAIHRQHEALEKLITTLVEKSSDTLDSIISVYHHLQHAGYSTLGEYLLSWASNLLPYLKRLDESDARLDLAPPVLTMRPQYVQLGAAVSRRLGFSQIAPLRQQLHVTEDHFSDPFFAMVSIAVALGRLSEDLRLYTSSEFAFFELPDALASGSSMLPQKKNPFALQAIIGQAAVAVGRLSAQMSINISLSEELDSVFQAASLYEQAEDVIANTELLAEIIANGRFDCPSSDDLRLLRRLRNGGSGSSEFEVMRPAADAASVSVGWSGA